MPTAWLPVLFSLILFCKFVACYCVTMGAAAAPLQADAWHLVDVKCINIRTMAVVNGIMGGGLSGSVGKVTFRKGIKGETIASQKAEKVHNPQTEDQAYQRMCMNTAMKAYSAMKEICNHSFEGVQYGQKSMSLFIQENLYGIKNGFAGVSQALNFGFTAKGVMGNVAPRPFLVSKGTLKDPAKILDWKLGAITWQEWKQITGMKEGDQLTIVGFVSGVNLNEYDADEQVPFKFSYRRYKFKDAIKNETQVISGEAYQEFNPEVLQSIEEEGDTNLALLSGAKTETTYEIKVTYAGATVNAFAFIVSRNVNGVWQRSTANLKWAVQTAGIGSLFQYDEKWVIKTYGATARKFLNNANV